MQFCVNLSLADFLCKLIIIHEYVFIISVIALDELIRSIINESECPCSSICGDNRDGYVIAVVIVPAITVQQGCVV